MYAESLTVGPWLESAARWVVWARQSAQAYTVDGPRRLAECSYNLRQAWEEMERRKADAKTRRDWAELQQVDAEAHAALVTFYQFSISEELKQGSNYLEARGMGAGLNMPWTYTMKAVGAWAGWKSWERSAAQMQNWLGERLDGGRGEQMRAKVAQMRALADAAAAKAETLAKEAAAGYREAGEDRPRSRRLVTVAGQDRTTQAGIGGAQGRAAADMTREKSPWDVMGDALSASWLGLPVWAWGAVGLAAALLLIPRGPSLVVARGDR